VTPAPVDVLATSAPTDGTGGQADAGDAVAAARATGDGTGGAVVAAPDTDGVALNEFSDPDGRFVVGVPRDWRMLSAAEIRAQFGNAADAVADQALANVAFEAVSPDGRALIALTQAPLTPSDSGTLDDIVARLQVTNAASIPGLVDAETEAFALDGVAAVRLTYAAVGAETGAAGARVFRQVVTTDGTDAIILTFVVAADDLDAYDATYRRIEASWRWLNRPEASVSSSRAFLLARRSPPAR